MNMKRYVLLLFVMLSALSVYAQSGMTDTQVMEFIVKEHNKGTSQTQIVTKLMQNGVDISQIRRVRDTYEKMKKGNSSLGAASSKESNTERSRKNNGQQRPGMNKKKIAEKTMQDYEDSEYGQISDADIDVVLESVKLKQNDLENDMQLKYNTYTTLMAQLKAADAKLQEHTPVFTTIQGAEVPVKPSGPKRMLFVLEMFISAFIILSVYVIRDILH
ncbi:putative polysialic acid transport protein [Prevotella intermedia]|uniref:Polysialic acid transport protein n=1 Tax=Prevotella intermedia TaxID=28131 RepID=A0AAD1F6Y2_PREIN|nr:putative polysialic acid transport protein [Prevotella intermedia]